MSRTSLPAGYDSTDVGNAKRFAKQHGDRIRYVDEWKRWLIYDGKRWALDKTREATRLAQETAEAMLQEAVELPPDDPTRAERIKRAVATKTANRIRAMIELAQPHCAGTSDDFDRGPFLANCQNGTLDLRTGKMRKHDPDHMLTKVVPVEYDPSATCPRWQAFLDRIFAANKRLIGYVQRAFGAAMVGVMQDQCFHLLYGIGANGKSTLIEVIRAAVGDYAMHVAATTFLGGRRNPDAIRSDLARLKGARLVTASETERGGVLDEATIKALTGGDTITARHLYQGEGEFRSAVHIFVSTNHKPRIKGTDHAIWRRVRLVPFTVKIPRDEQDLNLEVKLREELEGIFAWIIEGALVVQKADGRLEPVPEVTQAVESYRNAMDDIGQFLTACTVTVPRQVVGAKQLYKVYSEWCEETGRQPLPLKPFRAALEERSLRQKKREAGMVWLDLVLLAEFVWQAKCRKCRTVTETNTWRVKCAGCGRTFWSIPWALVEEATKDAA